MTDDFFRARLDQMIDLKHPLAVLAQKMPWSQIEKALAPSFSRKAKEGQTMQGDDLFGQTVAMAGGISNAGRPKLSIRLMASLLYLKHANNLSDEALVERWSENVVWQYFSGMDYYEPRLPCDATQIGHFRHQPAGPPIGRRPCKPVANPDGPDGRGSRGGAARSHQLGYG